MRGSKACSDLKTYGLMKLAAQAVKSMRDLKDLKAHWSSDPIAFDEPLAAMTRTMRGFRPMTALDLVAGSPELGAPALAEIVREIQATDPARPLGKISKRQRAALRLQSDLGESG
jgi:hypothetical protein